MVGCGINNTQLESGKLIHFFGTTFLSVKHLLNCGGMGRFVTPARAPVVPFPRGLKF